MTPEYLRVRVTYRDGSWYESDRPYGWVVVMERHLELGGMDIVKIRRVSTGE